MSALPDATTPNLRKSFKEDFAQLCSAPSREQLRRVISSNTGEYDDLDVKRELQSADVSAKDILAMANKAGGALIFGIEETDNQGLNPIGLKTLGDKTEYKNQLSRYLPQKLQYEVIDLTYDQPDYGALNGRRFRVVIVEYRPAYIPYLSEKESEFLKRHHVYIRHNAATVQANYEQLQDILNRRIETSYSTARELSLKEHLGELKQLYDEIPSRVSLFGMLAPLGNLGLMGQHIPNPFYPKEDYEQFVARMIEAKKRLIDQLLQGRGPTK